MKGIFKYLAILLMFLSGFMTATAACFQHVNAPIHSAHLKKAGKTSLEILAELEEAEDENRALEEFSFIAFSPFFLYNPFHFLEHENTRLPAGSRLRFYFPNPSELRSLICVFRI